MKRNPEDMISISDLYIGLKLYDLKESSKFDLNMNFAMIQNYQMKPMDRFIYMKIYQKRNSTI